MKVTKNIFWYLFLFYFLVHLVLFPICFFYTNQTIDLESFGISEYVKDYLSRICSTLLTFTFLLLLSLKKKFYLDKNRSFILFLLTTILFFDTLGNFFGWFDVNGILRFLWFDDVIHFFSPILVSLSCIWYLYVVEKNEKYLSLVTASCVALTLSSIWEIYEYWSDRVYKTEMLKGGIEDTMSDMTAGLLGVIFFSICFCIVTRKSS
ncbi:hypothetical protein GYA44_00655 [Candidatus Microgenomates bacterium]|jgi:uncharacterized membrane protein YjdF|nr:hypothetical protein [Candidatus Microgenomates bacterium]